MNDSKAKKVLLVDDNRIILHLLSLTFADKTQFEVMLATDGEQALSIAGQFKPQFIVLDVMLPGNLDGLEVCRMMKASTAFGDSKIILLSARGQEKDIEEGKSAGADLYLTKPFSPQYLLDCIKQFEFAG